MDIHPELVTPEITAQVEAVRVEPDPPADFAAFWLQLVDELEAIPPNLAITPLDSPSESRGLRHAIWSADSLGGRRISGPLVFPERSQEPAPAWVYSHGYGSIRDGAALRPDLARQGFIALGLDARGYYRSRVAEDPTVPGWATHGIESKDRYILRGAVADALRAVQVARSLEGSDPDRTVLGGGSFAGGLAILAAPWVAQLRYVAVSVPTFGAYDLRRHLVKEGSGAEINTMMGSLDQSAAHALRERLRYFDSVNAAAHIADVPVTVGLGVSDVVVPGETVAAIYHALATSDKELLSYPCSHSSHPLTSKWQHFERHIQKRAATLCGLQAR